MTSPATIAHQTDRDRLVQLRSDLGLSFEDFAAVIGKKERQLRYYELGKVEVPQTVAKLIDYMIKEREAAKVREGVALALTEGKKMISRKLVKEVHIEAWKLRELATDEERAKLDFKTLKPDLSYRCIYGQMTGSCYSDRAERLIKSCAKVVIHGFGEVACSLSTDSVDSVHTEWEEGEGQFFSPIETYIANENADNKQLIAFLKGERKTLNLMPSVNC
jgi:transcriptional regulator with XRE-family HTH domain